jgi:uncharacterized protein (DUF2384 family)
MQRRESLLLSQDGSQHQELVARVRVRVVDASGPLLEAKPRISAPNVLKEKQRPSNLCG